MDDLKDVTDDQAQRLFLEDQTETRRYDIKEDKDGDQWKSTSTQFLGGGGS